MLRVFVEGSWGEGFADLLGFEEVEARFVYCRIW
jgi:hypothetical protein